MSEEYGEKDLREDFEFSAENADELYSLAETLKEALEAGGKEMKKYTGIATMMSKLAYQLSIEIPALAELVFWVRERDVEEAE